MELLDSGLILTSIFLTSDCWTLAINTLSNFPVHTVGASEKKFERKKKKGCTFFFFEVGHT